MSRSVPTIETFRAQRIESKRLELEPLDPGHASEMAIVLGSTSLHRFTGGAPAAPAELRTRYERLAAGSGDPLVDWLNWMLRVRDGGELAGTVQATVRHRHEDPVAEVAWVIGVRWQGRGLAKEAVRAVVSWLEKSGVATMVAHIHPEHAASAAVARAAGFVPTKASHRGEVVWRRIAA
jgi:RimJ/RimL family protein N-acetyltransferase